MTLAIEQLPNDVAVLKRLIVEQHEQLLEERAALIERIQQQAATERESLVTRIRQEAAEQMEALRQNRAIDLA